MASCSGFATRQFMVICIMFLALGSGFCVRADCTPSTCPDGPVVAYFQYSNCSGEVYFEPVEEEFDVCLASKKKELFDWGFIEFGFEYDPSTTCDHTAVNATYEYEAFWFGKCDSSVRRKRESHYSSYMYLSNVNASFVSPQDFDNQPLPEYNSEDDYCYSVDNCTLANGSPAQMWYTYYSQPNCANPQYSESYLYMTLGVCHNYYNESYHMIGCIDENTQFEAQFSDAQCTQPISAYGYRYVCSSESYYTTYCTAPPTNIFGGNGNGNPSNPSPVSSAPTSHPTSFFALFIVCLLLMIFNF